MRIEDFRTFPHVRYRVDIAWSYLEKHIEKELEIGFDINPDFQRGHVWTEKQQIEYCEYIIKGGTSGKEIYINHPNWMNGFEGEYVLVDGKQRIEAVLKFMNGKIPIFGHYVDEFEQLPPITTASFSWNIASLQTRKEVLQWYLDFNAGGTPHSEEEILKVRRMLSKEK